VAPAPAEGDDGADDGGVNLEQNNMVAQWSYLQLLWCSAMFH
jgi:hypothetical protein